MNRDNRECPACNTETHDGEVCGDCASEINEMIDSHEHAEADYYLDEAC